MNHIYRLVWNESKRLWVVASENSRSHKKGAGRAARKLLLTSLIASGLNSSLVIAAPPVATTVVPTGGNARAYISANGVPVVNINAANATGLSHNTYTRYDVEANGLVLNNGDISQISRQSQLAGQIAANTNLVNQASIILNEVVSTNRSSLAGFTEVLGGRADVIVANPNGITCNGCGFINTDRATLTTGTSNIGSDGSLTGFTVNRGDISIEGLGVNATDQQIFDLVARSVKIDGNINASATASLGITTGNNSWNYNNREVTATTAASGATPGYAIDSSALGGMYAGRIRIIATEAGVGVRMLGDAAASADDFTLSSAGKIEIQSNVSAQQNLSIATTSATGADDLLLNDSKVSAGRDLTLSVTNGEVKLTEGELYAGNNLDLTASVLNDTATNDNTRYATGNKTITTTYIAPSCGDESQSCNRLDSASIDGSVWGAGKALTANVENLIIGSNGAELYAGTTLDLTASSRLNFGTATVYSVGDMSLTASYISTTAGAAQGIYSKQGNLNLTAGSFNNAGTMSADIGDFIARVDYGITNYGTLHAGNTLDLASLAGFWSSTINNSGTMIADGDFIAQAYSFNNREGANILATTGTTLTADSLINDGIFIASDTEGETSTFTLASLENNSTLQTKGNLNFNLTDSLENTGEILATNNLSVNGNSSALDISNSATGRIQAGGALSITGTDTSFDTQQGIVMSDSVNLSLKSLRNDGRIQSASDMTISIDDSYRAYSIYNYTYNIGVVHAGGDLNWSTTSNLNNFVGAAISALGTLSLESEIFYNYGTLYAGGLNGTLGGLEATIGNLFDNAASGEIYSSNDITTNSAQFRNYNRVYSANDIFITTNYFLNSVENGTPRVYLDWGNAEIITASLPGDIEQCTSGCTYPSQLWIYEDTIRVSETIYSAIGNSPELIAGNNMTIDIGAGSGRNILGLISAVNTLTLDGTGDFTNQAFSNNTVDYKRRYFKWKYDGVGITETWYYGAADENQYTDTEVLPNMVGTDNFLSDNEGWWSYDGYVKGLSSDSASALSYHQEQAAIVYVGNEQPIDIISSNIQAGSITGTLGNLNNLGIAIGVTDGPTVTDNSSTVNATGLNDGSGISFNNLNITLPTNPNGFFVPSQNPNANYLIETNPLFNVNSNFVGSNYMLDNFGYNPDESIRRLGDSSYEAYLIRQQLISKTGANILEGYGTEADQMKTLMDQAIAEDKAAGGNGDGFTFGEALTADQIASLGKDIVWMVETEVQGQRVLTPVVYLAPGTTNAIATGAVIGGENINLQLASLTNTGGTITGSQTLKIVSENDITNTSGTMRGGDVDLTSTQGSIINQTQVKGAGDAITYSTDIGKTASIESTGTMKLDANKDIKVIGAEVTSAGDADINAGGSIIVDTIVDKTITSTGTVEETTYSTKSTSVNTETETNIGSGISIGGNAKMTAGDVITVRGSDVDIVGEAEVDAKNGINIVDAVDKKRTTTITESSELFGSSSEGEADSGSHLSSESGNGTAYAKAQAEAEASAEAEGSGDFKLGETVRTVTNEGSDTSVGSSFNVGGKLTVTTEGTMKIQGSDIESGGEMELNVKNIEVLAGQNHEWSDTTTTRSSIGIYAEGDAAAKAGAEAGANAGTSGLGADAGANSEASADASGTVTFGAQTSTENSTQDKVTNRGSSLKSGSGLTINATGDAKFVGAEVESKGDMSINAENIINEAAKDTESNTYSKTTETKGIYLDASASAEAKADANADTGLTNTAGASGGVGAEAEVGAGLRYNTKTETTTDDSVTNVGNSFKSGGSFSRTAKDTIVDQGTAVDAGGDFTQDARVIRDEAIHDVKTSTSTSSETDVRIGVYAGGEAEASGEAKASMVGRNDSDKASDKELGAGFSAKYENSGSSTASEDKTAVTSKFKSGGNIKSTSSESTTLVGTQFESAGDTTIEAKTLDYKAAQDSSSSSSSSDKVAAQAKVSVYGSPGVKAEGEYEQANTSSESTTARTGSINAGGNLTIKTSGNATLEGTSLEAGNQAALDVGGSLEVKAARNTSTSTESEVGVTASFSKTESNKGMEAGAEGAYKTESSDTAVVGSIKSGAGGTTIKTAGNTTLEGTNLESSGTTSIEAGGMVVLKAAESTSSGAEIGGSAEIMNNTEGPGLYQGKGTEGGGAVKGGISNKIESTSTNINSAGGVEIKAAAIVNQEATIKSENGEVTTTGIMIKTDAKQSDIAVGDNLEYHTDTKD